MPYSALFCRILENTWQNHSRIPSIGWFSLSVIESAVEGFNRVGSDSGVGLASLEWGQAPKPPSFVALRATTQSTRWSLIQHWWQPKNKREWRYVEFSSGDSSIFTQKLERISKNLGGNPSWASPTRDCPLGFWIFSLVFS